MVNENIACTSSKIRNPEEIENVIVVLTPMHSGLIGSVAGFVEIDQSGFMSDDEKKICLYLVGGIEMHLAKTGLDSSVAVEVHNYVRTDESKSTPPIFSIIFIEGPGVTDEIIEECSSISEYLVTGIREQDGLFDDRSNCAVLPEKDKQIYSALIDVFVTKTNGKKIREPIGVSFSLEKSMDSEILLKDSFRSPKILQTDRKKISGYAEMNGYSENEYKIFLNIVNSDNKRVSSKNTVYLVGKWGHLEVGIKARLDGKILKFEGVESKDSSNKVIRVITELSIIDMADVGSSKARTIS